MFLYDGLIKLLNEKGLNKSDLVSMVGISSRTIAKISKGEKIKDEVIKRLCEYFCCERENICIEVSDNKLLQTLKDEKNAQISGGIYHETQIRLTYNSNRIEGSKLSEEQTRLIFETNTIGVQSSISVDDIIETANHFRALDYIIDNSEKPLTEEIIKTLHKILKTSTKVSYLPWFNVGDYKSRPNVAEGIHTTSPHNVSESIKILLKNYEALENITIEDIIEFHYKFERIHPFQDGNGRVGRLICFKECLRHKIVPFIIEDSKKLFYYRGLKEWENEKRYLIDTCLDSQDSYKTLLDYFEIEYK